MNSKEENREVGQKELISDNNTEIIKNQINRIDIGE